MKPVFSRATRRYADVIGRLLRAACLALALPLSFACSKHVATKAETHCSDACAAGEIAVQAVLATSGSSAAPQPEASGAPAIDLDRSAAGVGGTPIDAAIAASGSQSAASGPELIPEPIDSAAYLFDQSQLRSYNLVVAQSDLDIIDRNPSAEQYVPAGMEFEGRSYGPYRMRYKGNVSAFQPPCSLSDPTVPSLPAGPKLGKCSIKVDFDQADPQTRFYGLKKLNFHSMGQDDSMLRERLAYTLFREMGIAASRVAHARLSINGKLEGLFAVVEQVDGRFTRARFGEGGQGNLYKEVWPTYSDPNVYIAALETNTKQPAVQRMLDLKKAVDQGPAAFASSVDRDYLLRYVAVDRVIINDDGIFHFYCAAIAQGNNPGEFGNHNYYWYEALNAQRFWLIPWDMDLAFEARSDVHVIPAWNTSAACSCAHPEFGAQRPAACDPVVSHIATWLDDYNAKVDELIAGPFASSRVHEKLDTWAGQIEHAVTESAGLHAAPSVSAWKLAVAQLKTTIDNARKNRGFAY